MVKIIFGAGALSDYNSFNTPSLRSQVLDILLAHGITHLDTGRLYMGSEVALGQLEKRTSFTIDSKIPGGYQPGHASYADVIRDVPDSLQRVAIQQFDIYYIHAPDPTTHVEETLRALNESYKKGVFRRLGLSNFSAEQVQQVYDISKEKGYPLPTVYQGNYNPVARHLESQLFPTLRKLGIAFYAYSPLAGGFFSKTAAQLDEGVNRFSPQAVGGLYAKLYNRPSLRRALGTWSQIAEKEGVSNAELAYRWVAHHGILEGEEDGVIIGASAVQQVEDTLTWIEKGKLSQTAVDAIEQVWQSVKAEAPMDNYWSVK